MLSVIWAISESESVLYTASEIELHLFIFFLYMWPLILFIVHQSVGKLSCCCIILLPRNTLFVSLSVNEEWFNSKCVHLNIEKW